MANVTHADLTGANLHEPKGAATANSGEVYVADGAGSGAWTAQQIPAFMNKHIAGLTFINGTDATNDIQILSGTCRDSTNTEDMTLSAAITKRLDASWAVGDGNGGLDTGSIANTTYHIWLIKRTDTGVVDALFSASATAPTMPSNYDKKRRIGSIQRISNSLQGILVHEIEGGGIQVQLTSPTDTNMANSTVASNKVITGLPTGVAFEAIFQQSAITSFSAVSTPGITPNANKPTGDTAVTISGIQTVVTDTSAQVAFISTGNSGVANFYLRGWKDFRRD